MSMYNETYHPLEGDNLKNAMQSLPEKYKKEFIKQNDAATAGKIRDFTIVLVVPTKGSYYDGTADGLWMLISNGQMIGSSYEAIQ